MPPCGPVCVFGRRSCSGPAARSPGEGSFAHRLGTRRKASCAREPVKWPVPANCVRPHIVRPKACSGILPCGSVLRLEWFLAWVPFNLNAAIFALRYRRPIHALEAVADGSGGHPSALRRRGAGSLIVHRWRMGDLFVSSFRLQALLAFRLLLCMGLRAFGFRYM